ncbi:MAG: hypothetical protein WDN28_27035 [Chthoniobacter sp.]
MPGDLHHYSFRDMRHYISKINTSPMPSSKSKKAKARTGRWRLPYSRPWWRFFRAYVLRRGFLDGFPGLWIAVATGFFAFVRYSESTRTRRSLKSRSRILEGENPDLAHSAYQSEDAAR